MILRPQWVVLSLEAKSRTEGDVTQRLNVTCKSKEDATNLLAAWLDAVAMPTNPDLSITIREVRS